MTGSAAVVATGALLLGGCSTAGPEKGTDVEDIQYDPEENLGADFSKVRQYYGEKVTLTAEVSEKLAPHAFTIADDHGEELLVIYRGSKQISTDTGVKVSGTVKKDFSYTAAKEFVGSELSDSGVYEEFHADPYIAATSIETNVEF